MLVACTCSRRMWWVPSLPSLRPFFPSSLSTCFTYLFYLCTYLQPTTCGPAPYPLPQERMMCVPSLPSLRPSLPPSLLVSPPYHVRAFILYKWYPPPSCMFVAPPYTPGAARLTVRAPCPPACRFSCFFCRHRGSRAPAVPLGPLGGSSGPRPIPACLGGGGSAAPSPWITWFPRGEDTRRYGRSRNEELNLSRS